ncbi:MAG: hypothetical protein AAGI01_02625, partial [Myxococcota bacterium]
EAFEHSLAFDLSEDTNEVLPLSTYDVEGRVLVERGEGVHPSSAPERLMLVSEGASPRALTLDVSRAPFDRARSLFVELDGDGRFSARLPPGFWRWAYLVDGAEVDIGPMCPSL